MILSLPIMWENRPLCKLLAVKVNMLVAQSYPTLCDPIACSLPGSSVHGILDWVSISFFRGSSQTRSPALQTDSLLSEPPGQPQEYWSGLPFPSPGDLPKPGIEPGPPTLQQILHHLSHQERPPLMSHKISFTWFLYLEVKGKTNFSKTR